MSDYSPSNAELVAAIGRVGKHRQNGHDATCFCGSCRSVRSHNAHLDTLAAILDLHPEQYGDCITCSNERTFPRTWPCPTVDAVADALRKMGAL